MLSEKLKKASPYFNSKEYHKAIALFEECIREDPEDSIAYCQKATALFLTSEFKESLYFYCQAILRNPCEIKFYKGRSYVYFRLGKNELAIKDLEKVITSNDPEKDKAYLLMGSAYK